MLIVGNWKMNGAAGDLASLGLIANTVRHTPSVNVVICPPYTMLATVSTVPGLKVGAQDCHEADAGAFTGCVSASMVKAAGAEYVLLGHSERRLHHGETNRIVGAKAAAAIKVGLIPIICVGETAEERAAGRTSEILVEQVRSLSPLPRGRYIIAYEPIWAIGTGTIPDARDVERMAALIRSSVSHEAMSSGVPVLYGGSVTDINAVEFLRVENVDGLLLGGASLDPIMFDRIIQLCRYRSTI